MHFNPHDYESDAEMQAAGLFAIARALTLLGNADASTPLGAIENLSMVLRDGLHEIARSLDSVADVLREGAE